MLAEDKYSSRIPSGQTPVLHPIKARLGPPEQDSNIKKKSSASESDGGVYKEKFIVKDPRDKFSTFFRSCYSISYLEYQPFFIKLK